MGDLYTVDKGLHGQILLQLVAIDSTMCMFINAVHNTVLYVLMQHEALHSMYCSTQQ